MTDKKISFKVINEDDIVREFEYDSIAELLKAWYSDDCPFPANDCLIVDGCYQYNGKQYEARILNDVMKELEVIYWRSDIE